MSYQWSRADEHIGQGFLRIAHEQIAKAIALAEDLGASPDQRIHEARRRCKKLRALFRLVRPAFEEYSHENAFVRDAARSLSQARDLSVARETYAQLMGHPPGTGPAPAENAEDQSERETALADFARRMRTLLARSHKWNVDDIDLDTLAAGLKHTYRRARWTGRLAEKHRTDETFHEWRKYAKYHWNQLGLLEECARDVMPSAQKSAGDLAEQLGLHHDLAVLETVLDRAPGDLGDKLDASAVRDAIERRRSELEARITTLGQQVFAETPTALRARFAAYLSGWAIRDAAE